MINNITPIRSQAKAVAPDNVVSFVRGAQPDFLDAPPILTDDEFELAVGLVVAAIQSAVLAGPAVHEDDRHTVAAHGAYRWLASEGGGLAVAAIISYIAECENNPPPAPEAA